MLQFIEDKTYPNATSLRQNFNLLVESGCFCHQGICLRSYIQIKRSVGLFISSQTFQVGVAIFATLVLLYNLSCEVRISRFRGIENKLIVYSPEYPPSYTSKSPVFILLIPLHPWFYTLPPRIIFLPQS